MNAELNNLIKESLALSERNFITNTSPKDPAQGHQLALQAWQLAKKLDIKPFWDLELALAQGLYAVRDFAKAVQHYCDMLTKWGGEQSDLAIIIAVNGACGCYFNLQDPRKAVDLFFEWQERLDEALIQYPIGIQLINGIGSIAVNLGDYSRLYKPLERALRAASRLGLDLLYADLCNNVGVILSHIESYDDALEYLLQAKNIWEDTGSPKLISIYVNLSNIYRRKELHNQFYETNKKAYRLFCTVKSMSGQGMCFNNAGLSAMAQKQYRKALRYYQRAFRLFSQSKQESNIVPTINNLAAVYWRMEQYDKAIGYFQKSHEIELKKANYYTLGNIYNSLGRMHYFAQNYHLALFYMFKALGCHKQCGTDDVELRASLYIAETLHSMGKYDLAYTYMEKYSQLNEKHLSKERIRKVERLATHFEIERQQQDIALAMAVTANHELNQPLTVLRGNLDLLQMSLPTNLSSTQKHVWSRIGEALTEIDEILKRYRNSAGTCIKKYVGEVEMLHFDHGYEPESEKM